MIMNSDHREKKVVNEFMSQRLVFVGACHDIPDRTCVDEHPVRCAEQTKRPIEGFKRNNRSGGCEPHARLCL